MLEPQSFSAVSNLSANILKTSQIPKRSAIQIGFLNVFPAKTLKQKPLFPFFSPLISLFVLNERVYGQTNPEPI